MSRSTRFAALLWGAAGLVGLVLLDDAEACRRARRCQETYIQCGGCLVPCWVRCKEFRHDHEKSITCPPGQQCYWCVGVAYQSCSVSGGDVNSQLCWPGQPNWNCPSFHPVHSAATGSHHLCAMVYDPCCNCVRFAYPWEQEHGWCPPCIHGTQCHPR
jgi:hypothetical protein